MGLKEVHLALIFHCNQGISSFAQVAAENCYRGLVRVLDRHPGASFNFHWSGSLLTSLRWWYPDLVAQIREYLKEGRWETLASTYAQSVPHTGPDSLNRLTLGVHRAVLRGAFPDWTPRGYWISERSWRPQMADMIAEAGLEYALIEDHMLRAAGWSDLNHPKRMTSPGGKRLTIITDNEDFKHPINCAIWTGNLEPALNYIRRARDEQTGDVPPILTYGEDGEVCGLWPIERGCPPQIAWEHLDQLLTALENEPGVQLTRLCDYVDRFGDRFDNAPCIPDEGQARWMCASLSNSHMPYHEPGYRDWFDFNRRAPKLRRFRPVFDSSASEILNADPQDPVHRRLHLHASLALAAHTFEFGCIGIGSPRTSMWERHRVAQLPLALARGEVPTGNGPVNINGDRQREHALVSDDLLSLWSRRTGILLHLFDLPTGDELVGNEIAANRMRGSGHREEEIPETTAPEWTWSAFRSGKQRLEDFNGHWREVTGDRAWMRWLLNWDAIGGLPQRIRQVQMPREQLWSLENGTRETAGFHWPAPARQRALVERITVDGQEVLDVAALTRDPKARLKFTETDDGFEVVLLRRPVEVTKRVRLNGNEVFVDYTLTNHSPNHQITDLQITSEWVPSYLTLLLMGRESIEITDSGARNVLTGAGVEFTLQVGSQSSSSADLPAEATGEGGRQTVGNPDLRGVEQPSEGAGPTLSLPPQPLSAGGAKQDSQGQSEPPKAESAAPGKMREKRPAGARSCVRARTVTAGEEVVEEAGETPALQRDVRESLFGILDTRRLHIDLEAGKTQRVSMRFRTERGRRFDHIDHIAKDEKSWPGSLSH